MRAALIILALLVFSCSMPGIVVLNDPLSAQEHNDLGLAYEHKGMFDLAEKEYLKAAGKQPAWAVPCFNLGNLFYKKGDLKQSEGYYRKALGLDRDNPDIMNNLANLFHEQGHPKEARQLIEQAISIQQKEAYLDTYQRITGKGWGVP